MPPPSENTSPVVLLTGAGSGIGLIVAAKLLAHHDARIQVLTLMETPELSALEKEYQGRISSVYGDATDDGVIDEAIQACIANFGAMTHLISCIGTMLPVDTIRQVDAGAFRKGFDINFFSVVRLVQKSLPHLDKSPIRPTIVIVTSGADEEVLYRGWSNYCSSKAALTRFIHLLAHEERGIDVYGVLPAVTKSPMVDMILAGKYDAVMLPEERQKFDTFLKEGKIEPPEPIAEAMVKAAMGLVSKDSPEVRRDKHAIFIESLYQK